MIWRMMMVGALWFLITSCAAPGTWNLTERAAPATWNLTERIGGLGTEKFVKSWINPYSSSDGVFDLYYFTTNPFDKGKPTILFCAGGPGIVVRPGSNLADALSEPKNPLYNIVYFHLRGSGLSQLPPSNSYDRFLRTKYAVEDIERIREDLGINSWNGIVGDSYGTVLAQEYAKLHEDRVQKLVLIAPLSPRAVADSSEHAKVMMTGVQLETLRKIYAADTEFNVLTTMEVDEIANQAGFVLRQTEDTFRSVEFVIDNYNQLKDELFRRGLNYPFRFFRALRELRNVGWLSWEQNGVWFQEAIGIAVAQELLRSKPSKLKAFLEKKMTWELWRQTDKTLGIEGALEALSVPTEPIARRAYYVISIYDGLNASFLKDWMKTGQSDLKKSVQKAAGDAHVENQVNESIEKVGIFPDEKIEPWDPARFVHAVPTLILRGDADPVTAGGQAEHIYLKGLVGPRVLIQISGVGHEIRKAPPIQLEKPFDDPTGLCTPPGKQQLFITESLRCMIGSFLEDRFETFRNKMARLKDANPGYLNFRVASQKKNLNREDPVVSPLSINISYCEKGECQLLGSMN